jgi:hypothetical protein
MRAHPNLSTPINTQTIRLDPDSLKLLFAMRATWQLVPWGILEVYIFKTVHMCRRTG